MTTENKEYTSDEQQDANIVEDNARFIAKKLFGERKGHSQTERKSLIGMETLEGNPTP